MKVYETKGYLKELIRLKRPPFKLLAFNYFLLKNTLKRDILCVESLLFRMLLLLL